ncbi:MAG: ATP-binding protein [Magnetococcales bacterium]|nr:ATP-binding protein [Magnetococcales bacterium]
MLLRFIVENLFCFAGETIFSMVAGKDDAHPEHRIKTTKHNALRTSALYGANAHGKSRLLMAMALAKRLVVEGSKPDKKIPVKPYRLDSHLQTQPSRFEFTIFTQGIEYTYGFVVDVDRVHEEWLFSRPNKQEVCLFERVTDAALNTKITIGPSLARPGSKERAVVEFLQLSVRKNQLFLTECVERNFNKVKPVYDWFSKTLHIIFPNQTLLPVAHLAHKDDHFGKFVNQFLKLADTGISGIETRQDKIDAKSAFPDAPDELRRDFERPWVVHTIKHT